MLKIMKILALCISIICFHGIGAQAAQWEYPQNEQALTEAIGAFNWESKSGSYKLTISRSSLSLPEGFSLVRGLDAQKLMYYENGTEFPETEAVIIDRDEDNDNQLVFTYFEEGFITDQDWGDLDAGLLLKGITENTNASNPERVQNGLDPIHVLGWIKEPVYDSKKQIATWILHLKQGQSSYINAISLKLGRNGFSKIIWVGDASAYENSLPSITQAINDYQFDEGFRYADYSTGDKVAAVGLASLVAVSAGSNTGKGVITGLAATLLLFAKKLWFLIFLPFIAAWKWIKKKASKSTD